MPYEDDTEWHVVLVATPDETEDRAVVVEPTPRSKRLHPAWTFETVSKPAVRCAPRGLSVS